MAKLTQETISKNSSEKTEQPKSSWIEWVMPDTSMADERAYTKNNPSIDSKEAKQSYYCEWN